MVKKNVKIMTNNCKNCKWFEKANYINFCNNPKFCVITLPKGIYNKCPDWIKEVKNDEKRIKAKN